MTKEELSNVVRTLKKQLDTLHLMVEFSDDVCMPAPAMAELLGLDRTYFHNAKSNTLFTRVLVGGKLYVRPCKQIAKLLTAGYVCVVLSRKDVKKEDYEHIFELTNVARCKLLCFYKGLDDASVI